MSDGQTESAEQQDDDHGIMPIDWGKVGKVIPGSECEINLSQSTRNCVETAIDRSKKDKTSPWSDRGEFAKWAAEKDATVADLVAYIERILGKAILMEKYGDRYDMPESLIDIRKFAESALKKYKPRKEGER